MGAKKAERKAPVTKSKRAGLTFPVGRIGSQLKKGRYGKRISATAAVLLTSVLEYATKELLQVSAQAAGKHNIKPRHVMLAVREDEELSTLLSNVTIAGGGVAGGIHSAIEGKKKQKKEAGAKKAKKSKSKKSSPRK